MKTVFEKSMVAHVWAQQSQESGRSSNGNFYFEGASIYSYGSHFPIARFITRGAKRAVLLTTRRYSVTTSSHIGEARQAIPDDVPVFLTHNPLKKPETRHARHECQARVDEAFAMAFRCAPGGHNQKWKLERAEETLANANAMAEWFGWRFMAPAALAEIKARADAAEKQLTAAQKREAKKQRAIFEQQRRDALVKLDEWRRGERDNAPLYLDIVALRIHGDEIQTSRGATFPVNHGKRAFKVIAACRDKGREFVRNGHTVPLGHFQIDHIAPTGNVVSGCHRVEWPEIARVAAELGLLPTAEGTSAP